MDIMAARRREADGSEAIDGADSAIRWCGHGRGVALVRLGGGEEKVRQRGQVKVRRGRSIGRVGRVGRVSGVSGRGRIGPGRYALRSWNEAERHSIPFIGHVMYTHRVRFKSFVFFLPEVFLSRYPTA